MGTSTVRVKLYHGYGHTGSLVVYGHVFRGTEPLLPGKSNGILNNLNYLLRLFHINTCPFVPIRLRFREQEFYNTTEYDGFFRFEFSAPSKVEPGWHEVKVDVLDREETASSSGLIYVPHVTQYAFISDVDDTVMVSHSATIWRRLRELLLRNPRMRKTFPDIADYFELLSTSFTTNDKPNPFFYVSSSEWNLYDYLLETFRHHKMPEGAFLLNQIKRLRDLLRTGKTGHEGKLLRVVRILKTFPRQQFVLFGDNSQQDPEIYARIAERYPDKIRAVYIRNVHSRNARAAESALERIRQLSINALQFTFSREAILHSIQIGLIDENHPSLRGGSGERPRYR